jgi:predicted AlkP superfamily pyrophosphatase or phosphodiesterase
VIRALRRMPHMQVYRAADLPARLHIDASSSRVPPIWILPDEGWQVDRRSVFQAVRDNFLKGQHGYDPGFKSMHGLFIASGPAFKSGVTIDAVESVHVYNLLCAALGLTPAPNDGDDRLVRSVLRE